MKKADDSNTRDVMNRKICRFRQIARDLWNHYYRNDGNEGRCEYDEALNALYIQMNRGCGLPSVNYGEVNPNLQVVLKRGAVRAPIMINREGGAGYWDFPVDTIDPSVRMSFQCLFDWDQFGYGDLQYVRGRIDQFPAHPETVGKAALIEFQCVDFLKAS